MTACLSFCALYKFTHLVTDLQTLIPLNYTVSRKKYTSICCVISLATWSNVNIIFNFNNNLRKSKSKRCMSPYLKYVTALHCEI